MLVKVKPEIVEILNLGDHGVVIRALSLHWCGIEVDSLSAQQRWALSKCFIRS